MQQMIDYNKEMPSNFTITFVTPYSEVSKNDAKSIQSIFDIKDISVIKNAHIDKIIPNNNYFDNIVKFDDKEPGIL